MEAIKLTRRDDARSDIADLVVFDELITCLLSNEFFVPVFTGAQDGLRVMPLSTLVEHYQFPQKAGRPTSRLIGYIQWHNNPLFEQVKFYEDDSIEIDGTKSDQ